MTTSLSPSICLIHLFACACGSMNRGHRAEYLFGTQRKRIKKQEKRKEEKKASLHPLFFIF
jgi:hypothetical protein